MTLVHVKNLLLSHLLQNNTFSIQDDTPTIDFGKDEDTEELNPFKEKVVRLAVKELEQVGILKLVDADTELYLLSQPVNSFVQQVSISPLCAEMLADTVNAFVRGTDIDGVVCNKLSVTEGDIMALIHVFHMMLEDMDGEGFGSPEREGEN